MSKLALSIAGVIAVGGIAASLAIRHGEQVKLRGKAEAWRQQVEQLAELSAENERLSNLVTRGNSAETLPPEQLRELLRLRGQVGQLRQVAGEQAQLQATNERLRAGPAASEQELAAARAAPNFWPKEQLAFAGYADPEAALKTLLWAMNNGDPTAYLACWGSVSDVKAVLANFSRNKTEAEIAAAGKMLSDSLGPAVGFHLLDKKTKSADEVVLNLAFDGEGRARKFVLKRTGNEWKVSDMLYPGQAEP